MKALNNQYNSKSGSLGWDERRSAREQKQGLKKERIDYLLWIEGKIEEQDDRKVTKGMAVQVPRNFRLLEELEAGEKAQDLPPNVSFGLLDTSDATLSTWVGSIMGVPNTRFDGRMVSLRIFCGDNYPKVAPTVTFITRVNLPFVDGSGGIILNQFPLLKNWNPKTRILQLLLEILNLMQRNGSLSQPPEGLTY
jgi:ubiquitin-conjugating enzyme E2 variant